MISSVKIGNEYMNPATGTIVKALNSSFTAIEVQDVSKGKYFGKRFSISHQTFMADWIEFDPTPYI